MFQLGIDTDLPCLAVGVGETANLARERLQYEMGKQKKKRKTEKKNFVLESFQPFTCFVTSKAKGSGPY